MTSRDQWSVSTYLGKDGNWRWSFSRGKPYEEEEKALSMLRRAIQAVEEERATEKR